VRATENIEIVTDTVVEAINGEFALQSVTVRNVKTDERREIAVSGVFEAVGNLPRNGAFSDLVDLDAEGYDEMLRIAENHGKIYD
jgi:thioredoxin reductase (NADPH)